jgi:hypothetical protein
MKVMAQDVIVVRHPEFARLQHELAVATERFNQAIHETQGFVVFIGSLKTITSEDRQALLEQIEAEQEAYDVIRGLQDKVLHLLREENQAKAATTNLR